MHLTKYDDFEFKSLKKKRAIVLKSPKSIILYEVDQTLKNRDFIVILSFITLSSFAVHFLIAFHVLTQQQLIKYPGSLKPFHNGVNHFLVEYSNFH